MGITDLEEQFTFYASYHHSGINKIIHIFCVWPILWSALVFTQYLPLQVPNEILPQVAAFHPLNLTFLVAIYYATIYMLMDKRAGSLAALLVFGCLYTSRQFYLGSEENYGYPAWILAVGIHVFCWIAQFVGHGAFEGRAPALLDNIMQAFVMAPFFVFLEVIFPLGYRKDLQIKMEKNVQRAIKEFKSQQTQGKNKKSPKKSK